MSTNPFDLTDREAEVLRLVDRTRSTGEIAALVDRSIHTVEAQIKSARRRLGGVDRYRAAAMLRAAESLSQTEVNLESVMVPRSADPQAGLVDAGFKGASIDGSLREPASSLRDFASLSKPSRNEGARDDRHALRTILTILAIAAVSALLLLAAPQLSKGAQILAHRLLST